MRVGSPVHLSARVETQLAFHDVCSQLDARIAHLATKTREELDRLVSGAVEQLKATVPVLEVKEMHSKDVLPLLIEYLNSHEH
jgi:hypothetical protein